jgi:hypothetical protein
MVFHRGGRFCFNADSTEAPAIWPFTSGGLIGKIRPEDVCPPRCRGAARGTQPGDQGHPCGVSRSQARTIPSEGDAIIAGRSATTSPPAHVTRATEGGQRADAKVLGWQESRNGKETITRRIVRAGYSRPLPSTHVNPSVSRLLDGPPRRLMRTSAVRVNAGGVVCACRRWCGLVPGAGPAGEACPPRGAGARALHASQCREYRCE